jgi:hypothetical protein
VALAVSAGAGALVWKWVLSSLALDSWRSLAASPWLLAYIALTFTVGAAVTHIYDVPTGEHRTRVTGAFEAVLRAAGLVALVIGAAGAASSDRAAMHVR